MIDAPGARMWIAVVVVLCGGLAASAVGPATRWIVRLDPWTILGNA